MKGICTLHQVTSTISHMHVCLMHQTLILDLFPLPVRICCKILYIYQAIHFKKQKKSKYSSHIYAINCNFTME